MNRWEKAVNWWGKAEDRTPLDKTLVRVAVVLIILSFAAAILTTMGEFIFFRLQRFGRVSPAERRAVQPELRPGIHPLKLLPSDVSGFSTTARQQMPGLRYSAEAIYTPENEALAVSSPLNTYVRITYYGSEQEGLAIIKRALRDRYSRDTKTVSLDGRRAYSGYEANYGSYYLAWTWGGYAIEIDTSFTQNIPAQKGTILSDTSLQVAHTLTEIFRKSGI